MIPYGATDVLEIGVPTVEVWRARDAAQIK